MTQDIQIELSSDEALVLFEVLSRFETSGKLEALDPAEECALWNAQSALESVLAEPLKEDYRELLRQAKERLTNE